MLQMMNFYQVGCVALLALGTAFFWPQVALGALCGGMVMAANFWALRSLLGRLLLGGAERPKAVWLLLLGGKFIGVLALLGWMVAVLELDALGLALGMMALFGGVALGMAHHALKPAGEAP